jgi:hypothetical protein
LGSNSYFTADRRIAAQKSQGKCSIQANSANNPSSRPSRFSKGKNEKLSSASFRFTLVDVRIDQLELWLDMVVRTIIFILETMKMNSSKSHKYPLGTIAAYGPDDQLATKLVVAVFKQPGEKADDLHRWLTNNGDVRADPAIAAEVVDFFKGHGVKHTVASDRIIGCPHEEGVDYPPGTTCPQCPFWKDIDRFTHEPKTSTSASRVTASTPKIGRNDPCVCASGKKYKKCCGR